MGEFLSTYGSLIVSMVLGSLLGLSLYLPLMTGQLSINLRNHIRITRNQCQ